MLNLTLNELNIKLIYAKNFTPHKVAYYESLIREAIKNQNLYTILNPRKND